MKTIIFYLLSTVILLTGFSAHAQDIALGARGGISIPNLSADGSNNNPINTGYSSRQGADAGIFGEYKFSGLFSLEVMAEYSAQGGKKDGMQAFTPPEQLAAIYPPGQAPQYLYANYKSEAKLNYLMIPVLAKFGWNFTKSSPWRIYVDAGPFVSFLLSAKQVTSGESQMYADQAGQQPLPGGPQSFDNTQDVKSQLHTVNFGFEGNVGLSYRLGRSNIFIEGGGNYGLLNIQKNSQNGKNNTGAATGVLGYCYWFGNNNKMSAKHTKK